MLDADEELGLPGLVVVQGFSEPENLLEKRLRRLWQSRACCGARLRVIATVQDPPVVRTILAHLARSGTRKPPGPAQRAPAALA